MAATSDGNGGKVPLHLERRDKLFLGIAGLVMTLILGGAVPLSLYVFQTRSDSAVELAAQVKTSTDIAHDLEKHELEATLLRDADRSDVQDVKLIAKTTDDNLRTLMKDLAVPKYKIDPMPAGITFDDIDVRP